mmetsp:Transcript_37642/g.73747  ORF Transcript_37642/g.73747 Transcript_37642/m.73747 type:complete len:316 (+) Transcript_37642:664-1611(+)
MAARIFSRAASSGTPIAISRSKRPARRIAGSMASGLLVAPTTMTCAGGPPSTLSPRPSIHVSSCATILFSMDLPPPPPPPSLFVMTTSASSIKMMLGACVAALWKRPRTFPSLSPLMPLTSSGADTWKNDTPVLPATARARLVLPVPGGPWSSTPRGGSTPRCAYTSGCSSGDTMRSRTARRTGPKPAMSERRAAGRAEGATAWAASAPGGARPFSPSGAGAERRRAAEARFFLWDAPDGVAAATATFLSVSPCSARAAAAAFFSASKDFSARATSRQSSSRRKARTQTTILSPYFCRASADSTSNPPISATDSG